MLGEIVAVKANKLFNFVDLAECIGCQSDTAIAIITNCISLSLELNYTCLYCWALFHYGGKNAVFLLLLI